MPKLAQGKQRCIGCAKLLFAGFWQTIKKIYISQRIYPHTHNNNYTVLTNHCIEKQTHTQ